MVNNVLEDQPGKTDEGSDDAEGRKASAVAARKRVAKELKPVRHDPQAATSTADFVKDPINDYEAEGEEDTEAEEIGETYLPSDKSPEAVLWRKNQATDAARAKAKAAKAQG